MNYKTWLPFAGVLGIVALVVSLIFVGLEIEQSRESARSNWTGGPVADTFNTTFGAAIEKIIGEF